MTEGTKTILMFKANLGINQTLYRVYKRSYPVVSSANTLPKAGGVVTLVGNFGNNITSKDIDINVAHNPCTSITIIGANNLTCVAGASTPGRANLTVTVGPYTFVSDQLVVYTDDTTSPCDGGCGAGTCLSTGQCQCPSGSSGPRCSYTKPDNGTEGGGGVVVPGETTPSTTFTYKGVQFGFIIPSIQEIDMMGQVVNEYLLGGWTLNSTDGDTALSLAYMTQVNTANVTATIQLFKKAATVEFAGLANQYSADTIKASLTILGFPFKSSTNTLNVVIKTTNTRDSGDMCSQSQVEGQGTSTLSYLVIERNGVALYGRFINRSLSDGRPAFSATTIINQTDSELYLGITLPQCHNCILDPDFSVLVDPVQERSCRSSDNNRRWVVPVAVVVPIVALSLIIIAVAIFLRRYYIIRNGSKIHFVTKKKKSNDVNMDKD
ncbi:hypothetical protein SAMD00019534_088070 [Acytostelium subglobosum LB1]|uniref:hypothetical protein n=1 Tax=Acytostelium subglobosum LB1 TaxID=1410327 RepID=UPI0006450964|nr:hypothetical protein SAMD00019534_088070 [Acytostelium subglobosum LB1]GAM25632.1 hypothetical protein SAMD00019534_088070 [Acytostelium subglobosum LB1]|eukprot:XP_012751618.1 hypothetical protein SAMD00019534_088070 [Acytostelium subglobosum LB1]